MKSRFSLFLVRSALWLLPLTALNACTVSEVNPEMSSQTGSGESSPEMAVRLPSLRLANRASAEIGSLTEDEVGKTVVISGEVIQRSALLDGWLYLVQAENDSVWVLTDKDSPQLEDAVTVEGVVRYESVLVEDVDASGVYLEEKSHRTVNE